MVSETSMIAIMRDGLDDCILEYDEIKEEVGKLFGNYNKLELEISSLKTPFHRIYHKLRRKFLKSETPSIEDLISIQQRLVRSLRSSLEQQTQRSSKSLEALQNYSDSLDDRLAENIGKRSFQKEEDELLKQSLLVSRNELSAIPKSSPEYYHKRKDVKEKARNYRNHNSGCTRTNESIRDNLLITLDLAYREELIAISLDQSKSIVEASRRYEEYLGIMKGSYSDFIRQNKLYMALFSSVKRSKEFLHELDRIVVSGQKSASQLAERISSQKSYSIPLLEEITTDIHTNYEDSKQNLDTELDFMLGN